MKLGLRRSEDFNTDFDLQYRWYLAQAGEIVAEHYRLAVLAALRSLSAQPDLGRRRNFHHAALRDIRSFRLAAPFWAHLIFYRQTGGEVSVERLMHGARDLPRRLAEPPGA